MTDEEKIICKEYLNDLDKYHSCNEYHLIMRLLDAEPCEDVISRHAAINTLECVGYDFSESGLSNSELEEVCEAVGEVREDMIKRIRRLPSAQPEQRWIPCEERPPEEERYVLITKEPFKINGYEQEVIKAKRSVDPRSGKIEWWSPEFGTLKNKAVLAWMPLPEPYEEKKK